MKQTPFNAAIIIPTGIGATIGGFGGDGMTLLPLLASICDTVITHPNVANAACFQTLPENVLYVEGLALDRFFAGHWGLRPVRQNRIGILWDSGIPQNMEILHRNTITGVQTVYGVNIAGFETTREPMDLQLIIGESGRSTGRIGNPQVLLEAAQRLLEQGTTAIAVCCLMPESTQNEQTQAYKSGSAIDPIGGIEAMISHLLVSHLFRPAAHAPVFLYEDALPVTDHLVDPRAASEFIVSTFLPCVLTGLSRAPQYQPASVPTNSTITIDDLSVLLVPADALGSLPVLSALQRNIPVLAVTNNRTVMQATAQSLGIEDRVTHCASYVEALGLLVAMKQGITLPPHITGREPLSETAAANYAKA